MRPSYIAGVRYLVLLALLACGGARRDTATRPSLGVITGLARDLKTWHTIQMAEVTVAGQTTKTDVYGMYEVGKLAPGRHTLVARFADQPVTIRNIDVTAGQATYVDIPFTLGDSTPINADYGDARDGEIVRFPAKAPRIEGVVADASTRARVAGAVVSASRGEEYDTLQAVTDDHGRYRFDNVIAGTYAVSAYYSIGDRGQIEIRRSDLTVGAGEGIYVPLWIELSKQ